MDRTEARLECVRIAAQSRGGEKLAALARELIAVIEAPEMVLVRGHDETELLGAGFLAGDADRRSTPTDPDVAAAPPVPGIVTAKDPEGIEAEAVADAENPAPAGDGDAQATDRNEPAPPEPAAPSGGRNLSPVLAETLQAIRNLDKGEGVRRSDIVASLSVPAGTTLSRMKKLKTLGLLESRGHTTAARWFAVDAEPKPEPEPDPDPDPVKDWNLPAPRPEQRKRRQCLGGCDKYFMSDGPGNRICPSCGPNVNRRTGGLDDAQQVTS